MIGVLHKPGQTKVVEEFFELFKTPWEVYHTGRRYDVVIATLDRVPDVDARLLVSYGPEAKSSDASNAISIIASRRGGSIASQGVSAPIYDSLAAFTLIDGGTCAVEDGSGGVAGIRTWSAGRDTIRVGYDLFREVEILLTRGQPVEHAHVPTLDLHIEMLRNWILSAGVPLLEIPPVPSGHAFAVCLTHDIDFVGIRRHKFDPTMWGFLYRSTVGAINDVLRRKIPVERLFRRWRAALSLPFVYLGWMRDFWDPFEWYLRVEQGLPATYFLIPFKRRAGEHVPGRHASRRATAYDVTDVSEWTARLAREGCELGVHGIDAWHSVERGREELARVAGVAGAPVAGMRMHWLLCDTNTASVLEQAGYAYDSTAGYNETIGYRNGTGQVFRPLGTASLLEVPLHIQDGALFYPQQLDLSEPEAEARCQRLVENARQHGGVLTILWHDRSHGPERFWGGFYTTLVERLKTSDAWFGTASQMADWFRKRRSVRFDSVTTVDGPQTVPFYAGGDITPPFVIRRHQPRPVEGKAEGKVERDRRPATSSWVDVAWNGRPIARSERAALCC